MKLKYATSGSPISEPYLFGEKIFDCDWFYLGKEIEIEDKHYKRTFNVSLYQVEIQSHYYLFGAVCLDQEREEYLFYRIIDEV